MMDLDVVSKTDFAVGVGKILSGAAVPDDTPARHILCFLPSEEYCAPEMTSEGTSGNAGIIYRR